MALTFLTNVDEAILNGHINNLSDRVDNRIIMSDTPPEDLNALWVDTADTAPEFEQISIDTSLTHSLYAADAKVTGDKINMLNDRADEISEEVEQLNGNINGLSEELNDLSEEVSSLKKVYVGKTAPTDVTHGAVWIDTNE